MAEPKPEQDPLSFAELRATNVARCVNGFGHTLESWSVAEWTNAAIGELGEACNIAKKMLRHRDGVAGNKGDDRDLATLRLKLGRELADAVIYLDLVAASQGIDLGATVRETFNRKSEEIGAEERLPAAHEPKPARPEPLCPIHGTSALESCGDSPQPEPPPEWALRLSTRCEYRGPGIIGPCNEPHPVCAGIQHMQARDIVAAFAERERELLHALRTRPDYDFRCQDCGAPHNLDTSIPSKTWNAIARDPGASAIGMPEVGALCALCIDERLVKAGLTCDVAEFYFGGKALRGRRYAESTGTVEMLERDLATARQRLSLGRDAILADGYFTPEQVGDDIAPRIYERLDAARQKAEELERRATVCSAALVARDAEALVLRERAEAAERETDEALYTLGLVAGVRDALHARVETLSRLLAEWLALADHNGLSTSGHRQRTRAALAPAPDKSEG